MLFILLVSVEFGKKYLTISGSEYSECFILYVYYFV